MEFMVVGIIVGLIVGGAASWLVRSASAKSEAAALVAEHKEAVSSNTAEHREEVAELQGRLQRVDDTQSIVDAAKEQLNTEFQAAASRALQNNNEQFLQLAQADLGKTMESAKSEFKQRHQQFQELVKPLAENYGKLNPQIESLTSEVRTITTETARLAGALTDNQAVGNWGEIQLRRVVEIAGMTAYCEFQEQVTTSDGKPDMVITLPERRSVIVDAKASTAAFLEARQSDDEGAAGVALTKHASALKKQVDSLAGKNYGSQVEGSLNFVVMFVPGDQFLAAALRADPNLVEHAMSKQVAIATPASLIAMLWAIQNGWQQLRFAENAQEIKESGEEMHNRMLTFISRYQDVGRDLNRVVNRFNDSIGSFDGRIIPQGRKFSQLVVGDEDAYRVPERVENPVRVSRYATQSDEESAAD